MFPNCGISRMKGLIKPQKLILSWNSVRMSMWHSDSPGLMMCSLQLNVMRRRKYKVASRNALWHIDGNHQRVRWSLVIHGAIDGYSRRIMYLKCGSNNQVSTVLTQLEDAVKKYSMPSRRHGGENVDVAWLMILARSTWSRQLHSRKNLS